MAEVKHPLAESIGELKRALGARDANREDDWMHRMDQALSSVERSAWQHRADLRDPEKRAVDVDTSLNPSPVVARRMDALRADLDGLLREAGRLRRKLHDLHPPAAKVDAETTAGALPVAPEAADVADYGVFCERAEQLLQGFEHFDQEEAGLIQESVTMDLGAGD